MATKNMLLAGFGGQGILFAAKVAAYAGLMEEKQVSWLPSYGPEMRGGTANCSVCISDEPIGSPLVLAPDILVVMNVQSFDKFIDTVVPGGTAIVDSSLIDKRTDRDDISVFYIDATKQANANGLAGLANIIMLGKMLGETAFTTEEMIEKALRKCVPASKQHLLEPNMKAIRLGMSL
ncbi:2-oxoacid:acceptor oxidoreductase family protein [Candidatus Soleaferrea massiliensis]|uniref:2-oxoacid:acceptor oxidoreductase family protein n=1 Tax=Candidatus Soleaferrea massiliensis TaxID=1470354 RepID=UPI00058EA13E|nr:2-oxoacid:acceptor oxidoreductase family protein [Candidatus Soleaferrea massiliensis]